MAVSLQRAAFLGPHWMPETVVATISEVASRIDFALTSHLEYVPSYVYASSVMRSNKSVLLILSYRCWCGYQFTLLPSARASQFVAVLKYQ